MPAAPTERDPRFPSGPWAGYFQQRADRPTAQEMHFAAGRLGGAGADDCGPFTLSGSYDLARGVAVWTKRYAGYEVYYRGFAEDDSLWGVWELSRGRDRGGFRLWPERRARRSGATRSAARRPAVTGGEVDGSDPFAGSLAQELEPAGAA